MKTLIITLEYPPQIGGIASYVLNLANHLPSKDIIVYAPKQEGDKEFDATQVFKTLRAKPYWLLWPRWLRLLWQIKKIVKKEHPGMLYIQQVLPVGYVAYVIKKLYKIPFTIFLHGTDVTLATRPGRKQKKFNALCASATKIIVNSNFLKEKLLTSAPDVDPAKVAVMYPCPADLFLNQVPIEEISKTKSTLALAGKKIILTVSRLAEGKGLPRLVGYLPKILERVPNAVWLIVGDGPKRSMLLDLIQKNSLQNVVRFVGPVAQADLPRFYQSADVFVLLTHKDEEAEEGLGVAFLEAAASGLPVVAGKVGGVEEAVEHLQTGLVVDPYQEIAVVNDIAELLLNPDFAKQMGAAGRERIRRQFNWKTEITKLFV